MSVPDYTKYFCQFCDIFNNQIHPAYSPVMAVFHYGMFEVNLMNNMCSAVFFQPALGKGWLFSFIHIYIDYDWFSSLRFVEWYDSSIPTASASLATFIAFIPSTEIFTLVSRVMKFALSSQ